MNWTMRGQKLAIRAALIYERLSPIGVLGGVLMLAALVQLITIDVPQWRRQRGLQSQVAVSRHRFNQLALKPNSTAPIEQDASPLTTKEALPGVLADLSHIAQQNQLNFPEAEYTWTAPTNSSFGQYEVQFELKGGYLPIRHFIEDLENAEPEVAIRELSFTRDNATDVALRSRIRLVIFTKREAA